MKVLIIYNPVSGILYQHRDAVIQNALVKEHAEVEARWHYTSPQGSFGGLNPEEFDRIIACGGDGTVKEVASWLIENKSTRPLGIIPNGTANVLAAALGIPLQPQQALSFALSGTTQVIDVGVVNNREHFLIAAGCGFHSSIIKNTTRKLKRVFGFLAYGIGTIRTFFNIKPAKIFVKFDDHAQVYKAESVFVSNFSSFFNIAINPEAAIDDGLLNVTIYRALTFGDLWILVNRILRGEYARDWRYQYYRTKQVYILPFSKHTPIQIDGELLPLPYLDIRILPKALTIVAKKLA